MIRQALKPLWLISVKWKKSDEVIFLKALAKSFMCVAMAAYFAVAFTGCDNDSQSSATTAPQTTDTQGASTQILTTAPATADELPTNPAYNYTKLKQDVDKVMARFDSSLVNNKFRGTVYYKIGNDFEYIGNNGYADKGSHTYNSLNTNYYIGSLTKQFTACAIMLLQEQEKLSTSDTLDKYYPDCKFGSEVTIRNLLTMTSGLPDYLGKSAERIRANSPQYDISENNSAKDNHTVILNWILNQETKNDYEYHYSNSDYFILGDIIEKVSGKSYEEYLKENIFEPLEMTSTTFEATDQLATGYQDIFDDEWNIYPGVAYSSTGLISNLSDLLKWTDAVTGDQFLSVESKEEMFTPYKSGFAYGLYVDDCGNYYCNASFYRFNARILFTQDQSRVFIAFSNYTQSNPGEINKKLDEILKPYLN